MARENDCAALRTELRQNYARIALHLRVGVVRPREPHQLGDGARLGKAVLRFRQLRQVADGGGDVAERQRVHAHQRVGRLLVAAVAATARGARGGLAAGRGGGGLAVAVGAEGIDHCVEGSVGEHRRPVEARERQL